MAITFILFSYIFLSFIVIHFQGDPFVHLYAVVISYCPSIISIFFFSLTLKVLVTTAADSILNFLCISEKIRLHNSGQSSPFENIKNKFRILSATKRSSLITVCSVFTFSWDRYSNGLLKFYDKNTLTFTTLWANLAHNKLTIFFLFSPENRF